MSSEGLNKIRDLVRMEVEGKELVKLPFKSYRDIVNELVNGVKFGGALENTVASTYLRMVRDLVISLMRARLLKILDQAASGNVPRRNLLTEESKIVSTLEHLEDLMNPKPMAKGYGKVMVVMFTSRYFSIKTSDGSMISEPTVGDLVVLPKEDAVELASNLKVAKAYRIRRRRH